MRVAQTEDFEEVKEMVLEFIKTTQHISKYYEEDTVDSLIQNLLSSPGGSHIILLSEDGFLAGAVVPFIFGKEKVATEIGWYIKPEVRGTGKGKEFLSAFEYWAKNVAGCTLIQMSSLDDKVGEYLKGKGYELSERAYIKEV